MNQTIKKIKGTNMKSKTSTIEIVKAWKNIYSDFIVKSQKEQEKSEQELDKAIHELYQ